MDLTQDCILNGRLEIFQPKNGYRVAIDPIILTNFVEAKSGESVLDVGCGVGTISLILNARIPSLKCSALDVDAYICDICRKNIALNNLNIQVICDNLNGQSLKGHFFDHVVTNPPFFKKNASRVSDLKILANFETMELGHWISLCLKRLSNHGSFYIIHHAARVDEILAALYQKIGQIEVIPIFSKKDEAAKRVIIRGKKGCKSETKIKPGVVIHNDDGSYSEVAKDLLLGGF